MDEFEAKRGMVKVLMDMLKKSAGDELGGMDHKQVTLTPVSSTPVAEKPHQKESFDKGHAEPMKMADGGMPAASDEPERELEAGPAADDSADEEAVKNLPGPIEDEHAEQEHDQEMHDESMMDEDEDNNQSSFSAFLSRKRKK